MNTVRQKRIPQRLMLSVVRTNVVRTNAQPSHWAFFFLQKRVSSVIYLDMLENFVFLQLEELQPHVFLQQDCAPPHWNTIVRSSLDDHFSGRWIGRGGPIPWPPRSLDVTIAGHFPLAIPKGQHLQEESVEL